MANRGKVMVESKLIRQYLESVVDDVSGAGGVDGRPHSDRHHILLAHIRTDEGDAFALDATLLREAAVLDAQRAVQLRRVTKALAADGIDCLVLKGAAISSLVYPASHLRPRNDDDLWVSESQFARAAETLEACGYRAEIELTSSEITRQRHFATNDGAARHEVDLHWWPVNPLAFDALPSFDECLNHSVPLDAIGPHTRAPGPVHALLLACAHRVAHHTETEDAIWHCDLHFLAGALSPADWLAFESLACRAQVARVSGVQLQYVTTRLGTEVPADVVERLLSVEGEPSSRYLRPLGPLRHLWLELRARHSTLGRTRLIAHHLIPPRDYVAARYGYEGVVLLPFLYTHRAMNGLAWWTTEFVARLTR